jgi:ligand-binding sensor domain-containing protein/serine phosphatase RsbU (regulator of sigma subunit)
MSKNSWLYILLFLFAFSCTEKNRNQNNTNQVKVVEASAFVVPEDSMAAPKVILVDQSKLKKILVGKLNVVGTNTNIHPVGKPQKISVGQPRICKLGQAPFKLPKRVLAKDSSFEAGIPQIVIAKDAYTKDQNPENFSSFSKLQGLTHTNINFLFEDNLGNLWFGTGGGGVSKYDGNTFTNFTEKEGLSNNFVTSILQDKSGNLWFGTESGGVSKYDGNNFTHFTEKEGLSNNYVTSILQDKLGNLWFGTGGGGLSKYDGRMFEQFTEKEGLSNNFVTSIIQDKTGNIWIGTKKGGVSKYDGKSFSHYTEKEGLSNNFVSSILQDQTGNIWFGTNGAGIFKYDGKFFINFTETEGLSNNFVTSIFQDKSGDLWFGTTGGGASKFDYKTFTHFTEKEGLNNNIIRNILQDKNGTLWFAKGGGGVSKYNPKSFRHVTEKEGLSNSTVLSIIQDFSKKIWLGTEGGGVSIYDGNSYTHITKKDGLTDNTVYSILQDNLGNLWFGTSAGLTKYDGQYFTQFKNIEGLSNTTVYSILQDKLGCIWIGTDGGGAFKFDGKSFKNYTKKQGLSSNSVRIIFEDSFRNIWFGTYGGGLTKYNGTSFTHFTEKQGMPDNFVRSIIEDKSGNLWFGGLGFNGLTRYDGKSFYSFTENEGLSNNVVCSILQDKSGNIWVGTRFGLSKLASENIAKINDLVKYKSTKESAKYFESFVYEDGFLGVGCNSNAICSINDNNIWIGANDRLTVYNTSNFGDVVDTIAPNMQLTSIELFNENIPWVNLKKKKDSTLILGNGVAISNFEFDHISKWYSLPENLRLAYNNNYLTFNYIGITTMRPQKVKYQFKLEGIDENWSAITNKTEATYGNIPHGTYTFKVKAMNSEGFWSNVSDFRFVIRPPWWQTWWYRTLVVLLIIGSIWYYIKWRERKLKTEKEILEQTVVERTAEIIQEKKIVEQHRKEIIDSITYAERIQRSFIATKEILNENLNDYFVFFKPKDIVSGDFYWASKLNNGHFALATADSTGHGVPGAIMSLLNITSLEKAIETETQPSDILNVTRKIIIERLKKDGSAEGGKDGMDASITVYDLQNMKLIIAAANNPVWIMRGAEIIEIKADKMPVGKHDKDYVSFTQQEVAIQTGDVIYTLTDGFSDQFGGAKGKKFMIKNLRDLLAANHQLSMQEQRELLEKTFTNWAGNLAQVDDVTLIGVRV